jgi:hypothetical protein
MLYGSLVKKILLVCTVTYRGAFADYGFKFPRATDQLYLGQTINLLWDSKDDFVSLTLVFDDWTSRKVQYAPILIAGKHLLFH